MKYQQANFIQDENIFVIIGIALLCIGILYWTYNKDKKQSEKLNENESLETHTLNKFSFRRFYIIPGFILLMMIWELLKRI